MNITINAVIAEIRKLAAAQPDYIYPYTEGCFYTPTANGNEHGQRCIVGQALSNLGTEDSVLAQCEGSNSYEALQAVGINYDGTHGRGWVRVVQQQDASAAWGGAVGEADKYFPGLDAEYPPIPPVD